MRYLFILSLLLIATSSYAAEPLSVVVVGGGPVGLSAALEAVDSGAQVTVIEKRAEYTRRQRVFLFDTSIQLLERWNVHLPREFIFGGEGEERVAVVPIHVLEELLEIQACKKGVHLLKAEFEAIAPCKKLKARSDAGALTIGYDLLIAADGAYSSVRQELGIPLECFATAEGAFAWLQFGAGEAEFSFTKPIITESGFIRRIQSPGGTIIFSQGTIQGVDELIKATAQQGWRKEAQLIRDEVGAIAGRIPLSLQQARCFSNSEMSAILLGDAAATGSFFLGLGLNTGLETVRNSGCLLRGLQSGDARSYIDFEVQMDKTTNSLIEANRFLFLEAQSSTSGTGRQDI